ncbi:MAG: ATPase, T2SS/T4P/T4SS family [Candidatus Eisenbacteria bacterium]
MATQHKRLGDLLIEAALIDSGQLDSAIAEQKKSGQMLGAILVRLGHVSESSILHVLQRQLGLRLVDLDEVTADEAALATINEEQAKKYLAIPLEIQGRKTLVVAMADPLNVAALEDLRFCSGMFIQPVLAAPSQIQTAIERYYHIDTSMNEVIQSIISNEDDVAVSAVAENDETQAIDELLREAEGRPIVRLTNWLLHRAVESRASDIHIEPHQNELLVRLRVDGLLREEQRLPKWTQGAIVSRIKVLANLDIAEKRAPQDGRLVAEISGRRVDMRVSTLPLTNGEKVVMRVVDQTRADVPLDAMGLCETDLTRIKGFLARPQGILLVTGPTGSGKSTLLYSALRHIQSITRNITTVEDPVEYQIPGINQVQVDEKAKKTFAGALRAILRQDPDVIMIGEIRDKETAQIAFRASVTGHLVLSTVHTNDAAGAVTRLIDLGLEPFMVASSLVGVVSMRLVRTLCPKCKEPYEVDAASLNRVSGANDRREGQISLWRGQGCPNCFSTGYTGRVGIFEVLGVTDAMRGLITRNVPDNEIRAAAIDAGMRPIGEDGLEKALDGRTTLEEVSRVVYLAEQGVKVCSGCSDVISQDYEYCPACGHFVGEHCEKCARRLESGWRFCAGCGHESRKQVPAETKAKKSDSRIQAVPPGARKAS